MSFEEGYVIWIKGVRESILLEVRKFTVEGGGVGELFWRRRGYGWRYSVRRGECEKWVW